MILAAAVIFRVTLLLLYPSLSDDLNRYRWEGKVQAHHFNPYEFAPASPALAALRGPDYQGVNGKEYASVYPPLAELAMAANYRLTQNIRVEKLLYLAFDLAIVWLLIKMLRARGLPPERVLVYAWAPLAVIEIAGNGHLDAMAIFFFLLAFHLAPRRSRAGGLALGAAVATKYFPAALLPTFLIHARRRTWAWMVALGVLVTLPFLWAHGQFALPWLLQDLRRFSGQWYHNNDSVFALLTWLFGGGYQALEPARQVVLIVVVGTIGWTAYRRLEPLRAAFVILGTILLFSPNVFPWYVLWIVPLLAFYPSLPWLYFSVAVLLSYHVLIDFQTLGLWRYHTRWTVWEYAPLFALLAYAWLRARLRTERRGSGQLAAEPQPARGVNA